jgi:hypothetical protein
VYRVHQQIDSPEKKQRRKMARKITAIDILLNPDAAMIEHAHAANVGLRKNYPKGFALGEAHASHITVLQRYVYTADLSKLYAAAGKVLANENVNSWKLKAIKYDYIAQKTIGIGAFVVESTADLLRLQRDLVDAVAPFTAPIGTTAAFVATPQEPDINQPTIDYVATFVPGHSGEHFTPHVTVGIGTVDYWDALLAASFDAFTFSLVGASVYQLGNYGTAMKLLHTFKPTSKGTSSARTPMGG